MGIVGRTGSGKSSLISCLMRMVNIDSGSITIDGIDIRQIPLTLLRGGVLVMIPQDPVILTGPLRRNLDPHGLVADDDSLRKMIDSIPRLNAMRLDLDEIISSAERANSEKQIRGYVKLS